MTESAPPALPPAAAPAAARAQPLMAWAQAVAGHPLFPLLCFATGVAGLRGGLAAGAALALLALGYAVLPQPTRSRLAGWWLTTWCIGGPASFGLTATYWPNALPAAVIGYIVAFLMPVLFWYAPRAPSTSGRKPAGAGVVTPSSDAPPAPESPP